jgi:hypothetical protein
LVGVADGTEALKALNSSYPDKFCWLDRERKILLTQPARFEEIGSTQDLSVGAGTPGASYTRTQHYAWLRRKRVTR